MDVDSNNNNTTPPNQICRCSSETQEELVRKFREVINQLTERTDQIRRERGYQSWIEVEPEPIGKFPRGYSALWLLDRRTLVVSPTKDSPLDWGLVWLDSKNIDFWDFYSSSRCQSWEKLGVEGAYQLLSKVLCFGGEEDALEVIRCLDLQLIKYI